MPEDTDSIRQPPSAVAAADHLRLLARRARATARAIRRRRGRAPIISDYGPFEYRGGVLEVRALRAADGPSWSEACIANGDVIRPWWPPSSDWERDHDGVAFLAHRRDFERLAARGIAANFAIVTNGLLYGETTALLGEAGSTRAELVLWGDTRVGDKAPLLAAASS